jgi:hypothetical protein
MSALEEVRRHVDDARSRFPWPLSFAAGHDICEIVGRGVHHVFGRAQVALGRTGTAVEEVLRAAFTYDNFSATKLFADIKAWEAAHPPFRILSIE